MPQRLSREAIAPTREIMHCRVLRYSIRMTTLMDHIHLMSGFLTAEMLRVTFTSSPQDLLTHRSPCTINSNLHAVSSQS
jgi:hypothetical protein